MTLYKNKDEKTELRTRRRGMHSGVGRKKSWGRRIDTIFRLETETTK